MKKLTHMQYNESYRHNLTKEAEDKRIHYL